MQRVLANKCTIFNCILFTIGCWLFLWVAYEHRSEFADAKWPHKTSKKAYREFLINFKNIKIPFWMDMPEEDQCPVGTKLLVLVITRRNAFRTREAIRHSWAKDAIPGTVIRFFVADPANKTSKESVQEQINLNGENSLYEDLIIQHGFEDIYENLELKLYACFEWQQTFCPHVDWILKTDDDSVVHLPRLDYWTDHKFSRELAKNPATIFGVVNQGIEPVRYNISPWYVPEHVFPGPVFPPYIRGVTYLITRQAVSAIMAQTENILAFGQEDVVFTGILAQLANVSLSNQTEHMAIRLSEQWLEQWGTRPQNRNLCEGGMPKTVSMFGVREKIKELYELLWSESCY